MSELLENKIAEKIDNDILNTYSNIIHYQEKLIEYYQSSLSKKLYLFLSDSISRPIDIILIIQNQKAQLGTLINMKENIYVISKEN